jgi:hypothetical protein
MSVFWNNKKLELERIERQRIENELTEARRKHAHQAEMQSKELERQRQMQYDLECRIASERQEMNRQQKEARKQEVEGVRRAEEKRRMEADRIAAERKRERARLNKMKQTSPETLRDLRELIRERYELDVKIWALRSVRKQDRPIVQNKMDKADAVMEDILLMVDMWGDNSDGRWDPEEWEKVGIIRKKLFEGGHRRWADSPPWA